MKDLKFKDEDGNLAMTVFEMDEDGFINLEIEEEDLVSIIKNAFL